MVDHTLRGDSTLIGLVLVCGLGRCGTSLLMQMAHAGGWPTCGTPPAFEDNEIGVVPANAMVFLKWLDPHRYKPPPATAKVVFLTRDHKQQARSSVKTLQAMGYEPGPWKQLVPSLRRDERTARKAIERIAVPVLELTFENLVTKPRQTLANLTAFIGEPLDLHAAVAQLRLPRLHART